MAEVYNVMVDISEILGKSSKIKIKGKIIDATAPDRELKHIPYSARDLSKDVEIFAEKVKPSNFILREDPLANEEQANITSLKGLFQKVEPGEGIITPKEKEEMRKAEPLKEYRINFRTPEYREKLLKSSEKPPIVYRGTKGKAYEGYAVYIYKDLNFAVLECFYKKNRDGAGRYSYEDASSVIVPTEMLEKVLKSKTKLENIPLQKEDFYHGTEVTSIIVDGPHGNQDMDDGCGRFRVRHFGVATGGRMSSFAVIKLIRQIVSSNRDIKVWNLSLGSTSEIKDNFISPEAAELDKIQSQYDVLFVVAGTNRPANETKIPMKIGSPADSLNSLVINSVDFRKNSASYTRVGPVLSFFNKPDVSYYGGDGPNYYDKIAVCRDDMGAVYVSGTSFAAPWITRKIAYLVYNMGLTREIAKALIIDAAAGWDCQDDPSHTIGYGVVPMHISDIIHSRDDEIRFIMSGITEAFETYTYNLPVPIIKNAHPFYARATLVYFPQCDRNQGVDYTSTEMDIHFGRIVTKKGNPKILPINGNRQSDEGFNPIYEENARNDYRKWDNVKHISDVIKSRAVPRKAYESGLWGLSIKTKERMQTNGNRSLPFGVVVTLKEMNGVNRFEDFKRLCMARGWLVNELDVQNRLDIYTQAEEEIKLE